MQTNAGTFPAIFINIFFNLAFKANTLLTLLPLIQTEVCDTQSHHQHVPLAGYKYELGSKFFSFKFIQNK